MAIARSHRIIGVTLGLIWLTACGNIAGPPSSGTYVLELADGQALPISWQPTSTMVFQLFSDTLVLSSDQRFHRARVVQRTDLSTGGVEDLTETWEGSMLRDDGSWILLQDVCRLESLALCVEAPTLRRIGPNIEVRTLSPPAGLLLFVPLSSDF